MIDANRINYLAILHGLSPDWVRERMERGLPLRSDASDLSADWDDYPPFEASPRWRRIEQLPDGYTG